jgi:hypothetical protein
MSRTVRFAAVFVAAAAFAGAAFGQTAMQSPFTVRDLPIDFTSTVSHQDALSQGRSQARLKAAQRLIERLTLQEDRNAASPPLNATEVAGFAAGPITQAQDQRSSTAAGYRLISTVAQPFNADNVRKYLASHNVPYVDSQSGKALLVPSVAGGVDAAAWGAVWTVEVPGVGGQPATRRARVDETVLTPYVASTEPWPRRPTFSDVQGALASSGANHAVVAEAYSQGGGIYVRLIDLRTGAADTSGNVIGPFSSLGVARDEAVREMERQWKLQSIVRTTGSNTAAATATFADLGQWVKIKKGLEASRLVSGLSIDSISQLGADVRFTYAGRPDQLAADLRSRGVQLAGTDGGWTLQVTQ